MIWISFNEYFRFVNIKKIFTTISTVSKTKFEKNFLYRSEPDTNVKKRMLLVSGEGIIDSTIRRNYTFRSSINQKR